MLNAARRTRSAFGILRRASSGWRDSVSKTPNFPAVPVVPSVTSRLSSHVSGATTITYKNYATHAVRAENIDPLLQRLDEDVRRFGRLSRADLHEILQSIKMQNSIKSSQALLAIRCCGELVPEELPAVRNKSVNEMWNTFKSKKVPMDISHYNALLRVYIENDQEFDTKSFLKDLESEGLEPNRVTYQRIMWQLCQRGKVEEASHILEIMRGKSMPLNDAVLDALVLGHVRQRNLDGARSVLKTMIEAGVAPTSRTYSLLMSGYAIEGDIESVKKILEEGAQTEIYFADKNLMDVLEEFAVNGHTDHVKCMLDQMQRTAGYNQDAVNSIYRLVNKKCYDAALLILQSMTRPAFVSTSERSFPYYQGSFFIKHLVNTNTSTDDIVRICNELVKSECAPNAHILVADSAIQSGNMDLALEMFSYFKSTGKPVRQHYFWPFMCSAKNRDEVLEIMKIMVNDYDILPNLETLVEYVLPKINYSPEKTVEVLRESGVSVMFAVRSVLLKLLQENKITEASSLATIYGTRTNIKNIKNSLIKAFNQNTDIDAFVNLIKLSCAEEIAIKSNQSEEIVLDSKEILALQKTNIGYLVYGAFKQYNKRAYDLERLLNEFVLNGIGITQEYLEKIEKDFASFINGNIGELLKKMTDDDLVPPAYERTSLRPVRRSPEILEQIIKNVEAKGENPLALKKQLLIAYCRSKEVENVERLLESMEAENFVFTAGTLSIIMDMYCQTDNLEKALSIKEKIVSKDPDFVLDDIKILRLAQLLSKENKVEDLMNLLQNIPIRSKDSEDLEDYNLDTASNKLLSIWAANGDVQQVMTIFTILNEKQYIRPSNQTLSPIIKAHIAKGDSKGALKSFEEYCLLYRCTPFKNNLMKMLIKEGDATGLQKLTDLSTSIHGEINSLYDLVFAFIECDKMKQAQRILETPGMRIRDRRFSDVCKLYGKMNNLEILEKILEVSSGLKHIDRSVLFEELLNQYIIKEDTEKALGLWTIHQEESLLPSEMFLKNLAKYLKKQNVNVPFIVPESTTTSNISRNEFGRTIKRDEDFEVVQNYAANGEFENIYDHLIEHLKRRKPMDKFIKFAVNKLAANGQIEILEDLEKKLTEEQKKKFSFENKKFTAITSGGDLNTYFDELEKRLETMKGEDLSSIENIFPKGSIFNVISEDTLPRISTIMKKYADQGITSPISILWCYYVINNDNANAKQIWDQYLQNTPNIYYKRIIKTAKEHNDPTIITRLIEYLKTNPNNTQNSLIFTYSQKILILLQQNNIKEVNTAIESLKKDGISPQDLQDNVKERLRNLSIPF